MIESVDLRRLQVLRLVHRQGTVTAAAEVLRLTPSAVSAPLACVRLGSDRRPAIEQGLGALEEVGRELVRPPAAADPR